MLGMLRLSYKTFTVFALIALLSGCNLIYKTTGDVLVKFGKAEMVPYLLQDDDASMGCASGEALTPLLMSFEAVGSRPDQLAVMVYMVAATCAEANALEHELSYMRAVYNRNSSEARDARIRQKRSHEVAARRQYKSWQRMVGFYGEPQDNFCPKYKNDFDEFVWLVGLLSGIQSALNDAASGLAVGIPRDIAAKVERGAACLDNAKWWGVPRGMRSALWEIAPMLAPENSEPMRELEQAAVLGESKGVRLGYALWGMVAAGSGNDDLTKSVIREFVAAGERTTIDANFNMLDVIAEGMVTAMSDRLWTEATGSRTPMGGLGTFWDDKADEPEVNLDDLL